IPGATVTYTIVVSNNGPLGVTGATVTDSFPMGPSGFAAVTFISTASGGASRNTASRLGSLNDTVSLPPSAPLTLPATVTIATTTSPADALLTKPATVTSVAGIPDTNPSNNVASDTDVLPPTADLGVTKTGPAAATAGSNVTYTITVVNNGPSAAQDASLTDF